MRFAGPGRRLRRPLLWKRILLNSHQGADLTMIGSGMRDNDGRKLDHKTLKTAPLEGRPCHTDEEIQPAAPRQDRGQALGAPSALGIRPRAPTCQQLVSSDPARCLASHHGAPHCRVSKQDRCGVGQGEGGRRKQRRMAWHARGQGFKSPQLHPRSEAPSGSDHPRVAGLRQQIGSKP
jgi:hypothetical protein